MGFIDRLGKSRSSADWIRGRELLVPTPETGQKPGVRVLAEDEELSLVVVSDEEGRLVLPAFTSEEALIRWRPRVRTSSA